MKKSMAEKIEELLGDDCILEALDQMLAQTQNSKFKNEIIHQKGRLANIEEKERLGTASEEDRIERNKIRDASIKLLSTIQEKGQGNIFQPRWLNYFRQAKVLGSDIPVAGIYVSPTCSQISRNTHPASDHQESGSSGEDMEDKIARFLSADEGSPRILLILGYPGQGKSTICLKLFDDLAHQDHPSHLPYFVPLKDLNTAASTSLIQDPLAAIRQRLKDVEVPEPLAGLLLLDGLDELYMKNGLSYDDIYSICDNLERSLAADHPKAKAIITSRQNYIDPKQLPPNRFDIVQLDEFDLAKQQSWLQKYHQFQPECPLTEALLERFWEQRKSKEADKSIPELLGQPLTLFMVAQLGIDLNKIQAKASVYDSLFTQVIKRKYAEGTVHPNLERLTPPLLREALQQIAVSIYFSNREFISATQAAGLSTFQKIKAELRIDDPQVALRNLMMSFYFQEREAETEHEPQSSPEDASFAIEFLHKSLQEYLVAEHIWGAFKSLAGCKQEALTSFVENTLAQFSQRRISNEILQTIREMGRIYVSKVEKAKQTDQAIEFWNACLAAEDLAAQHDFLPLKLARGEMPTVLSPLEAMHNNRVLLRELMNAFGELFERSPVDDKRKSTQKGLGDYLNRHALFLGDMSRIYFRKFDTEFQFINSSLANIEFVTCQFVGVSFDGSEVKDAAFHQCTFHNCTFRKTVFNRCKLHSCEFYECTFDGADFNQVEDWEGSYLKGCSMKNIRMNTRPNFRRCRFLDTDFEGAYLGAVSFRRGLPGRSNFRDANLEGAFLAGDDDILDGVVLSGANLKHAKLRETVVFDTDFSGANMMGMEIVRSAFAKVNFSGAQGLDYEMLKDNITMHEITGLPPDIEERLRQERPEIWKEPSWFQNRIRRA